MQFWQTLWTIVWFGGLAIFAALATVISIGGARDLAYLLRASANDANEEPSRQGGEIQLNGPAR